MSGKRVVVTAVSALTPVGNDAESSWKNLVAGTSGIALCNSLDTTGYATRIAGEVKNWDPREHIPVKQAKRMERFSQFAVACSLALMENAQWQIPEQEARRVGVFIGCGLGGLKHIEETALKIEKRGVGRVSPFFIPMAIGNMAPGLVSIFTGAQGTNLAATSACASGTHAIGYAYSEILLGRADVMICGGVESTMSPSAFGGFCSMKAMSTRNEEPQKASRPFDADRDGFVMGEGCGLLLLETLEHAKERGATILAEVVGFGSSSDAFHMTAPPEEGTGMALAMTGALSEAGTSPEQIDHINAHGTSTPLNDLCETRAIKKVFGAHAQNIAITGNKSMIGHLLGGAGGVESVFSVLTLRDGIIPPTINLENPGEECDLDYTPNTAARRPVEFALCNSFGFGGTNASILFRHYSN